MHAGRDVVARGRHAWVGAAVHGLTARGWQAGAAIVGCAGVTALYVVNPADARLPVLCPYRALTGLPCPGCGLTRALHALLHGDPATAFAFNPLLFVALPLLVGFAAAPGLVGEPRAATWRTSIAWILLVLTLAFWVWRNTPGYPLLRL